MRCARARLQQPRQLCVATRTPHAPQFPAPAARAPTMLPYALGALQRLGSQALLQAGSSSLLPSTSSQCLPALARLVSTSTEAMAAAAAAAPQKKVAAGAWPRPPRLRDDKTAETTAPRSQGPCDTLQPTRAPWRTQPSTAARPTRPHARPQHARPRHARPARASARLCRQLRQAPAVQGVPVVPVRGPAQAWRARVGPCRRSAASQPGGAHSAPLVAPRAAAATSRSLRAPAARARLASHTHPPHARAHAQVDARLAGGAALRVVPGGHQQLRAHDAGRAVQDQGRAGRGAGVQAVVQVRVRAHEARASPTGPLRQQSASGYAMAPAAPSARRARVAVCLRHVVARPHPRPMPGLARAGRASAGRAP